MVRAARSSEEIFPTPQTSTVRGLDSIKRSRKLSREPILVSQATAQSLDSRLLTDRFSLRGTLPRFGVNPSRARLVTKLEDPTEVCRQTAWAEHEGALRYSGRNGLGRSQELCSPDRPRTLALIQDFAIQAKARPRASSRLAPDGGQRISKWLDRNLPEPR